MWAPNMRKCVVIVVTSKAPCCSQRHVREVVLWPMITRENILPDEVRRESWWRMPSSGEALVEFCSANWEKLPAILGRLRAFAAAAAQSSMDICAGACSAARACGRQWADFARDIHAKMGATQSSGAWRWWGQKLFVSPPFELWSGQCFRDSFTEFLPFPLLGLEKARAVRPDDWRFNDDIVSWVVQLLWFEGAGFVIARSQILFSGHLRYTRKTTWFSLDHFASRCACLEGEVEAGWCRRDGEGAESAWAQAQYQHSQPGGQRLQVLFCKFRAWPGQTGGYFAGWDAWAKGMLCLAWTVDDACTYIVHLELGPVIEPFPENALDGRLPASLSEADLVSELRLKPLAGALAAGNIWYFVWWEMDNSGLPVWEPDCNVACT